MGHPLRKQTGRVLLVALFAAVVLSVSVLVRSAVPAAWHQSFWSVSSTGTSMFTAGDGGTGYIVYDFTFRPVSESEIETAVEVSIQLSARGPRGGAAPLTVEAIAAARAGFIKECRTYTSIPPEVASSFDAIVAAGSGQTLETKKPLPTFTVGAYRVDLPGRHAAAQRYFWATQARTCALMLLGLCGVAAVVWLFPQWLSVRRLDRFGRCTHCGYDLAGISGTVCPECGRSVGA